MIRSYFFFFNDTATTEIYTLSLHDALPISANLTNYPEYKDFIGGTLESGDPHAMTISYDKEAFWAIDDISSRWMEEDRKSTRLNSSHANISYAVFCLKKKNITINIVYE